MVDLRDLKASMLEQLRIKKQEKITKDVVPKGKTGDKTDGESGILSPSSVKLTEAESGFD